MQNSRQFEISQSTRFPAALTAAIALVLVVATAAQTQSVATSAGRRLIAIQLSRYWVPISERENDRCNFALAALKPEAPELLKPFDIVILRTQGLAGLPGPIAQACPGAVLITSVAEANRSTTMIVPTNKVLFATQEPRNSIEVSKLLAPTAVLTSVPQGKECCRFAAELRSGSALDAVRFADALAKNKDIKYAQVNVVHLLVDTPQE